jgi:WS/DGAT/MGAT family acyltransferase
MAIDRLSALDEAFLRLDSRATPMHVGWTLLVEGEPPSVEALREHVGGRLHLLPRFRRRPRTSALHLHDPVWVDDPHFDLARHIAAATVEEPGGPAELRSLSGSLLSLPLDRRHPLWRMWLVDELPGGRFAVVGQAHHALVDGLAAVEVAQLLLDSDARALPARPRPWSPTPEPSLAERAWATVAERARVGRAAGSLTLRALVNPGVAGEGIEALRRLGSALEPVAGAAPRTALNRRVGPRRSVAFAELPLPAAKELGRDAGATVNDVVLATAALALGRYLRRTGECHPWLRTLVPVSTRPEGTHAELGNRVSFVLVELPIGERSPGAALEEVCRQMRVQKSGDSAGVFDGLLHAARFAPLPLRDAVAWVVTRPQTFNVVVSNLPGPREPLYLMGRPLRAAYPAVPLPRGQGLSVGILSYRGVLHVGLYADPQVVADVVDVAHDFTRSFDALRFALAPRAPEPGAPEPDPVAPAPRDGELAGHHRVFA